MISVTVAMFQMGELSWLLRLCFRWENDLGYCGYVSDGRMISVTVAMFQMGE